MPHCVACDMVLDSAETKRSLCVECNHIVDKLVHGVVEFVTEVPVGLYYDFANEAEEDCYDD